MKDYIKHVISTNSSRVLRFGVISTAIPGLKDKYTISSVVYQAQDKLPINVSIDQYTLTMLLQTWLMVAVNDINALSS